MKRTSLKHTLVTHNSDDTNLMKQTINLHYLVNKLLMKHNYDKPQDTDMSEFLGQTPQFPGVNQRTIRDW